MLRQELKTQWLCSNRMKKVIIFDTGSIISFGMNGLLPELKKLKANFKGNFIITNSVKREIIDKPLSIKRFELDALKVKRLLNDKVFELPTVLGITHAEIEKESKKIMNYVNSMFVGRRGAIKLIHDGESSCLALNGILLKKGYKTAIAVDERTTRLLGESPENLKKLMERRMRIKIEQKKNYLPEFKKFIFLRSVELIYVAHKKGYVRWRDPRTLDALLYAMKFKGASVSSNEIEQIKKLT